MQTGLFFRHSKNITIKNCTVRNFTALDSGGTPIGGHGLWLDGGNEDILISGVSVFHNGPPNSPNIQNGGNISIRRGGGQYPANRRITLYKVDAYESYGEDGLQAGDDGEVYDLVIENSRFWNNKEDGADLKKVVRAMVRNSEFWGHRKSPTGGGCGVVSHIGAKDVLFDLNITHDNDVGFCTGGVREAISNVVVSRNLIYRNSRGLTIGKYSGDAQYPPPGISDFRVYQNTIVENDVGLRYYWWPDGLVDIRNNIFESPLGGDNHDFMHWDGLPDGTEIINYNDYPTGGVIRFSRVLYNRDSLFSATGHEASGLSLQARYTGAAPTPWSLAADSPLIDKGDDLGLPFQGKAPDIGAYEAGQSFKPGTYTSLNPGDGVSPGAPMNLRWVLP